MFRSDLGGGWTVVLFRSGHQFVLTSVFIFQDRGFVPRLAHVRFALLHRIVPM